MRNKQFILSIITLLLLLLCACGHKGPVRPLETATPNSVQAPELRQQGDALLLAWQLPTSNRDGSRLLQEPIVDIYRKSYDPQDECPECIDRSPLLVSIDPRLPAPARKIGTRFLLHDSSLQAGSGYQYKLVVRNQDGELSQPVILRQLYDAPPPAPEQFSATPQDRSASLSWQPPQLAPGDILLGYQVYRRQDNSVPLRITSEPLSTEAFEDFGLDNGTRYHYQVRVLVERGKGKIEGLATAELSLVPKSGI